VNAPNTTATAPSPNYSVHCCVGNVPKHALKSSSLKLLTQPCNRLWENCSLEGCTHDPDTKMVTCNCTSNWTFYVSTVVAIIGAIVGGYYMPPNSEHEIDPYNKAFGGAGHMMWMSFFVYCFYRSVSHSASAQLVPGVCTRPKPNLRGA